MRIKSFYADSMDMALQSASKEMGDEALILNTRESPHEFRHYGRYEVVCACAILKEEPAPQVHTPVLSQEPRPQSRLVALVGPAGAGKSSVCAKIAIQAKFQLGLPVSVITWDSERVGGSDYLRSYCEVSEIPFHEVDSASRFLAKVKEESAASYCVIDSPALGACSAGFHAQIVGGLNELAALEKHLVISTAYSASYLKSVIERYSVFQPGFLLPTHLDEADFDGKFLDVEVAKGYQVRWSGTGPSIPEDLKEGRSHLTPAQAAPEAVADPVREKSGGPKGSIDQILRRYRKGDYDSPGGARAGSRQTAA